MLTKLKENLVTLLHDRLIFFIGLKVRTEEVQTNSAHCCFDHIENYTKIKNPSSDNHC